MPPLSIGPGPYTVQLVVDQRPDLAPGLSAELRRRLVADLRLSGRFRFGASVEQTVLHVRVGARRRAGGYAGYVHVDRPTRVGGHLATYSRSDRFRGQLAHRLANAIYRLASGERGPFLSQLAFVAPPHKGRRGRQVQVVNFDGSSLRGVSDPTTPSVLPAWSPRRDLLYSTFAGRGAELVQHRRLDGPSQSISRRPGLNMGAAISPDGRLIALALSHTGNTDLYLVDRRGGLVRRLTRHPKIDISPSWSPDGRELIFVSDRGGRPRLFRLQLEGGQPRRLTRGRAEDQQPDWCKKPGSTWVAFARGFGNRYEIQRLDLRDGSIVSLTHNGGRNTSPRWSPNCRLLAYAGPEGLQTMTEQGHPVAVLYRGAVRTPAWSSF